MNVTELYYLTEWINSEISAKRIPKLYTALHAILEHNNQPNQQKQPFDQQKNALIDALRKVPLNNLTLAQVNFLHDLGIGPYVGTAGIGHLEEILVTNPIDIATAASNVQQIITSINQGIEKATTIRKGLEGCVKTREVNSDEVLIRVNFSNDAAMANITDLKEWGNIWHSIGRGIAIIHDIPPEDIRIVGASNGSIILDLGVSYLIAETVSKIMNKALDIAERIIQIRGQAEKVRTLRLSNDKIAAELDVEAKKVNEEGVNNLTTEIFSQLGVVNTPNGDKQTALNKAVKHLIDFLSKGGEIDCVLPERTETTEEGKETENSPKNIQIAAIRESFNQIRDHSAKLRVLEYTSQQDEEDEPESN